MKNCQGSSGPQHALSFCGNIDGMRKTMTSKIPLICELLVKHHYSAPRASVCLPRMAEGSNRYWCPKSTECLMCTCRATASLESTQSQPRRLGLWKINLKISQVPTLVIGGTHDYNGPKQHMEWMSQEVANCDFCSCPNGSHLSQYDWSWAFISGLIQFFGKMWIKGDFSINYMAYYIVSDRKEMACSPQKNEMCQIAWKYSRCFWT